VVWKETETASYTYPVGGHFDQYAVVFVDYLNKWPEVFLVRDQIAPTIAKLLVEKIICCHGVPNQLLSNRGAKFLSNLLKEGYSLMGIKKLNTTAYHPQTDGLVERFNKHCYQRL
jgi:transposase InsO family protein